MGIKAAPCRRGFPNASQLEGGLLTVRLRLPQWASLPCCVLSRSVDDALEVLGEE